MRKVSEANIRDGGTFVSAASVSEVSVSAASASPDSFTPAFIGSLRTDLDYVKDEMIVVAPRRCRLYDRHDQFRNRVSPANDEGARCHSAQVV